MNSILNPAYPHIIEKIFTCLNFDLVSISNFRLLNHQLKNTLENVLTKDLARLILLRKFKELTKISGLEIAHRDIFHKLGQTWLNLIELLNQENLWSCDVTENMFICIFRICCLVENRNLQTFYFEPMYLAFKMGSKFDNLSLIETITKPAYSPNFMLSACHEYKDEANEDGNLYFFSIKGMIENRSMRHA